MVEPFRDIDPVRVAANLAEVRAAVPDRTEILVACKYVPCEEMGALAEAGVELVGENRLGDLQEKHERWNGTFTWDFIGNVQSRKVRDDPAARPADPLGALRQRHRSSSPSTETTGPRS